MCKVVCLPVVRHDRPHLNEVDTPADRVSDERANHGCHFLLFLQRLLLKLLPSLFLHDLQGHPLHTLYHFQALRFFDLVTSLADLKLNLPRLHQVLVSLDQFLLTHL